MEKPSWSKGKRTRRETYTRSPLDCSIPTLFLFLLGESGYATRRSKIEEGADIVDDATTECDQLIRLLGIARRMRRVDLPRPRVSSSSNHLSPIVFMVEYKKDIKKKKKKKKN